MAPSSGYDAAQPSPELPALPPPTLDPVSYNSRTPAARLPPAQGLPPNPRAGVSHAYPPVADRNGSANGPGDSQRPAPSAQRHPTGLVDGPELREERSGAKKVNPLMDLIRTEGLYVEDLSVIIKRVAAAWSRANFPPTELDTAFRSIEAVYRTNKALLRKLNDIGPTPESPKALGDLLMSWVPEIESAYIRYTDTYLCDFDTFAPVQSNDQLHPILASLDWPATLAPSLATDGARVSLDVLFLLPLDRLKYYKKLFAKLLRSTQEGKSDHDLLVSANHTLDELLDKADLAFERSVVRRSEDRVRSSSSGPRTVLSKVAHQSETPRGSFDSNGVGGPSSSSDRFSGGSSAATSAVLSGPPRIEDLERRLCTDRALDIFTMLPKKCKLQMAPPNLAFARTIRRASDVKLSFYPLSDPSMRQLVLPRAYIFLLTDLFLICSRLTPEERAATQGPDGEGPDMWLLYPPLAGKHLRVSEGRDEGELEIVVMKKERLSLRAESGRAAQEWKAAFEETIAFGMSQGLKVRTDTSPIIRGPSSASTITSAYPSASTRSARSPPPLDSNPTNSFGRFSPNFDQEPMHRSQSGQEGARSRFDGPGVPLKQTFYGDQALPGSQSTGSLGSRSPALYPPPSGAFSPVLSNGSHGSGPSRNGSSAGGFAQSPLLGNFPSPSTGESSIGSYTPASGAHPGYPPFGQAPGGLPFANGQAGDTYRSASGSFASGHSGRSSGYSDPPPSSNYPAYPHRPSSQQQQYQQQQQYRQPENLSPARAEMSRSRSADGLRDGSRQYSGQGGQSGRRIHSGASSQTNSNPGSTYGDARQFPNSSSNLHIFDPNNDDSPPPSPLDKTADTTLLAAQMRCKIFLQQHHASWKSLGTAKLKLFISSPSNTKQLVVESDKSDKRTFVSTIVLTDGVEKVGKTGVAIELSDKGNRTGIIYMLQMKTEQSALGLFDQLLLGSDRGAARHSVGPR